MTSLRVETLSSPPRNRSGALRPVVAGAPVAAVAGLVACVLLTGQAPRPAPAGLPDAGPVVAWAVLVSRTLLRLTAVGALGCLLTAGWLLPGGDGGGRDAVRRRLMAATSWWAAGWFVAALVLMVSSSADLLGVPLRTALSSSSAWSYVPALAEGRALLVVAPATLAISVFAGHVGSRRGAQALAGLAAAAMAPMLVTGHAASASHHYLATQSILLHVLAVTVWVGGLLGLLHVRGTPDLGEAVARFSALALPCFALVALTGVLSATTRLGLDADAWTSTYGGLVVGKVAVLAALGLAGWRHRTRTVPAVGAGRPGAFWRLAAGEVLLMAAALGLAVTLARTAPPARTGFVAGAAHAGGRFAERGLAPVSPMRLVGEWRPDALVVTAVVVATGAFLARTLRQRRLGPVLWFLAAMALLLWALVGAPAAYGSGLLSAHVGQLLLCAVVVPRLLARSDALPPLPTRLADPMNAAVLLAVLLVGVYATPLLDLSQVDGSVRLLVDVLALAVGLLGTGGGPGAVRRGGRLVAVVLAGFGAGALVSPSYAAVRLESLAWEWADPGTDQAVAGLLALAVAALLVVRTASVARYEEADIRGS